MMLHSAGRFDPVCLYQDQYGIVRDPAPGGDTSGGEGERCRIGGAVTLHGLVARPEFNSRQGKIVGWNLTKKRWIVSVAGKDDDEKSAMMLLQDKNCNASPGKYVIGVLVVKGDYVQIPVDSEYTRTVRAKGEKSQLLALAGFETWGMALPGRITSEKTSATHWAVSSLFSSADHGLCEVKFCIGHKNPGEWRAFLFVGSSNSDISAKKLQSGFLWIEVGLRPFFEAGSKPVVNANAWVAWEREGDVFDSGEPGAPNEENGGLAIIREMHNQLNDTQAVNQVSARFVDDIEKFVLPPAPPRPSDSQLLRKNTHAVHPESDQCVNFAELLLTQGKMEEAEDAARLALELAKQVKNQYSVAKAAGCLSQIFLQTGKHLELVKHARIDALFSSMHGDLRDILVSRANLTTARMQFLGGAHHSIEYPGFRKKLNNFRAEIKEEAEWILRVCDNFSHAPSLQGDAKAFTQGLKVGINQVLLALTIEANESEEEILEAKIRSANAALSAQEAGSAGLRSAVGHETKIVTASMFAVAANFAYKMGRAEQGHELIQNAFQACGRELPDSCIVCLEPLDFTTTNVTTRECMHSFHNQCDQDLRENSEEKKQCPMCRSKMPSAMIEKLREDIEQTKQSLQGGPVLFEGL